MFGRTVSAIIIAMLLTSTLALAFNIQQAKVDAAHSSEPANAIWLEPSIIPLMGKTAGYKFNVTAWINLNTSSYAWEVKCTFNGTVFNVTRAGYTAGTTSRFFSGHVTLPDVAPRIGVGEVTHAEIILGVGSRSAGSDSLCWFEFQVIAPSTEEQLVINNNDGIWTFVLDYDLNVIATTKYDALASWNVGTPAPVGIWNFDEGSGSIAYDSSGNGNGGTVFGASWTNGVSSGALQFDGVDDYVGVPSSPSLCVTGNQMSVQLWMKPTVTLDANTPITNILDKGDEYGFQMDQYSSGRIWFFVWLEGAPWQGIQTTTSRWEANSWYLLTGTYDGSSLKVYVNGVLENSRPMSNDLYTSGYPLAIGSYCLGTKNFFNGAMDEVRIYNYARTAEEIQGDFFHGWDLDFAAPTNHPIVDFAVYNGSLYAAADNKLYVKNGNGWNVIEAPSYVTSLETINVTNQDPPATEWNQTCGGTNIDEALALVQTGDGGYALAGWTNSFGAGNGDSWLIKTDSEGEPLWNRTYGEGGKEEKAWGLVETSDKGFALAGHTRNIGTDNFDLWLVRTDSEGNMLWNVTYGGIDQDVVRDLVQTDDGGFVLVGHTYSPPSNGASDVWVVKINSTGGVEWCRNYGGPKNDEAWDIVETDDGGYAIPAFSGPSLGPYDLWLIKTNASGIMEWSALYGDTGNDSPFSLVQTRDGGYAIAGFTSSYGAGDLDFWLVRTDSQGNMLWNNTYGGTGRDWAYDLVQTSEGGFALAGFTNSFGAGGSDFWLVRTDSYGNELWNATYGENGDEWALGLVETRDFGYALAGSTTSYGAGSRDSWLVKTMTAFEEELVVGGQGGLYCYDGKFFTLVFSVPTYTRVLGIYDNRLYAGTMLANPPKLYYCNGSPENPANWHIDSDFSDILDFSGPFGSIVSFAVYNGKMCVGSGNTVYSFDGTSWSVAVSYEYAYAFLDMQVYDGKLFLATRDQNRIPMYLGGTGFSGVILEFDGENWTTVLGHDYWIYSLEEYDGKLYVGTANRIYTFNGTFWDVSFYSEEGAYYAVSMINYDGKIYAGMGNGYIFADPAPPKPNAETTTVPEFSPATFLTVFMMATLLSAILLKKREHLSANRLSER